MLIAKHTGFVVREHAKCKLARLKFHKASKMKSHFQKILGFRLFLMTLMPVGFGSTGNGDSESCAKVFSNIILADLHS